MGHNIQYYTYPANANQAKINNELDEYARKATWQEGGHGLHSPIRFIDRVMDDYNAAMDFLRQNDKGWYDQLAVKYRKIPHGKTSKKIEELREKLKTARQEHYALNSEVPAKNFKADFVGCRHCGSKISRTYIKSNSCPVCNGDMRSDTIQKKLAALVAKIEKLSAELQAEEKKFAEKFGEICWLVKIEYHT